MSTQSVTSLQINFERIPVLPSGVPYLLETLMDNSIAFSELANTIEHYPSISARLIALANSAWSSPASEITSLEMACTRLGLDIVRSTCIALSVSSPFNPDRCPVFDSKYYWTTSLLAADGAAWLSPYSHSGDTEAPTARAAGLLHNLGLLWIAEQMPDQMQQAITLALNDESLHLSDALLYLVGFDYCEVGRQLGLAWKLPECLVNAMAYHKDEDLQQQADEYTGLVGVTVTMLSALQRNRPWAIPQSRLENLQISQADATGVFDRLAGQVDSIRELAEILFVK